LYLRGVLAGQNKQSEGVEIGIVVAQALPERCFVLRTSLPVAEMRSAMKRLPEGVAAIVADLAIAGFGFAEALLIEQQVTQIVEGIAIRFFGG
jgi:hypothetical protein